MHMLPRPTGKRVPAGTVCSSSPGIKPSRHTDLESMGSVPMPWRNTHAMIFSAMIPYVVYGVRKCGLSSRIGNICSLHGAATGSPLSESRGRSDASQRSRVLVRSYVQQSVQALTHVAQSLSALGQDRCTRHQEALVVAWQPLPVAGSTKCSRHHRTDTGITFPCKKSIDAS